MSKTIHEEFKERLKQKHKEDNLVQDLRDQLLEKMALVAVLNSIKQVDSAINKEVINIIEKLRAATGRNSKGERE